jgi:hypothetical protein
MKSPQGTPAAVAGISAGGECDAATAAVEDRQGRLAGVLLAEVAFKLAGGTGGGKGLLPLPEVIGREEAERIANEYDGKISMS